jgi:hypothetical protein
MPGRPVKCRRRARIAGNPDIGALSTPLGLLRELAVAGRRALASSPCVASGGPITGRIAVTFRLVDASAAARCTASHGLRRWVEARSERSRWLRDKRHVVYSTLAKDRLSTSPSPKAAPRARRNGRAARPCRHRFDSGALTAVRPARAGSRHVLPAEWLAQAAPPRSRGRPMRSTIETNPSSSAEQGHIWRAWEPTPWHATQRAALGSTAPRGVRLSSSTTWPLAPAGAFA